VALLQKETYNTRHHVLCLRCLILIGHFPQKSPVISGSFAKRIRYVAALLRKEICNLRHPICNLRDPMHFCHPVFASGIKLNSRSRSHPKYVYLLHTHTHTCTRTYTHTNTYKHTSIPTPTPTPLIHILLGIRV